MKKSSALFLTLGLVGSLAFTSCSPKRIDPEVETFLSGIRFDTTYETLTNGTLNYLYQHFNKDDELIGEQTYLLNLKRIGTDLFYEVTSTYLGNAIKDGVSKYNATLYLDKEENEYVYKSYTNDNEPSLETLDGLQANQKFTALFVKNTNPFMNGGIFYGDYFNYSVYKYAKNFKIIDGLCVYQASDNEYFNGALTSQDLRIEKHGLIKQCEQSLIVEESHEHSHLTINADYQFLE